MAFFHHYSTQKPLVTFNTVPITQATTTISLSTRLPTTRPSSSHYSSTRPSTSPGPPKLDSDDEYIQKIGPPGLNNDIIIVAQNSFNENSKNKKKDNFFIKQNTKNLSEVFLVREQKNSPMKSLSNFTEINSFKKSENVHPDQRKNRTAPEWLQYKLTVKEYTSKNQTKPPSMFRNASREIIYLPDINKNDPLHEIAKRRNGNKVDLNKKKSLQNSDWSKKDIESTVKKSVGSFNIFMKSTIPNSKGKKGKFFLKNVKSSSFTSKPKISSGNHFVKNANASKHSEISYYYPSQLDEPQLVNDENNFGEDFDSSVNEQVSDPVGSEIFYQNVMLKPPLGFGSLPHPNSLNKFLSNYSTEQQSINLPIINAPLSSLIRQETMQIEKVRSDEDLEQSVNSEIEMEMPQDHLDNGKMQYFKTSFSGQPVDSFDRSDEAFYTPVNSDDISLISDAEEPGDKLNESFADYVTPYRFLSPKQINFSHVEPKSENSNFGIEQQTASIFNVKKYKEKSSEDDLQKWLKDAKRLYAVGIKILRRKGFLPKERKNPRQVSKSKLKKQFTYHSSKNKNIKYFPAVTDKDLSVSLAYPNKSATTSDVESYLANKSREGKIFQGKTFNVENVQKKHKNKSSYNSLYNSSYAKNKSITFNDKISLLTEKNGENISIKIFTDNYRRNHSNSQNVHNFTELYTNQKHAHDDYHGKKYDIPVTQNYSNIFMRKINDNLANLTALKNNQSIVGGNLTANDIPYTEDDTSQRFENNHKGYESYSDNPNVSYVDSQNIQRENYSVNRSHNHQITNQLNFHNFFNEVGLEIPENQKKIFPTVRFITFSNEKYKKYMKNFRGIAKSSIPKHEMTTVEKLFHKKILGTNLALTKNHSKYQAKHSQTYNLSVSDSKLVSDSKPVKLKYNLKKGDRKKKNLINSSINDEKAKRKVYKYISSQADAQPNLHNASNIYLTNSSSSLNAKLLSKSYPLNSTKNKEAQNFSNYLLSNRESTNNMSDGVSDVLKQYGMNKDDIIVETNENVEDGLELWDEKEAFHHL